MVQSITDRESQEFEAPRVLVVDDEKVIREILADFLSMEGFAVGLAEDGTRAVEELHQRDYDMVISDLKMPRMGGLELLERIRESHDSILVVIMTGFGTVETAIEAMKKGAYDYILKPFKVEEVVHIVKRGLEKQRLISENIRLKETLSLYEMSEALASSLSLDQTLESMIDTIEKEIRPDCLTILLEDVQEGFELAARRDMGGTSHDIGELDLPLVLQEGEAERPILATGAALERFFFRAPMGLVSFGSVPLRVRSHIIGVVNVYSWSRRLTEGQRKLLSLLGARAAASIENARLYKNLQDTFRDTIAGLARALEAMDKYTAGHSDRVAAYARMTARELGLPEDEVEMIGQAALMHDIGKLGCHANLNNPGKLTDEEYEIIKLHPGFGKEILDPITFLHPLAPGVHLHHERWDGTGYPLGLQGEEIPIMARVLAVADTYDAMTSNRAYRKALPARLAEHEIRRCSGGQFDPGVVTAFLSALKQREAGPDPANLDSAE
jgi:response regulator RpfG family c-di-GMP phosphodiesterase